MKTIKITILSVVIFLQSCDSKKTDRYIPLGGGDIQTFLDTQTNEVYTVQTFHDAKPWIYKTALSDANRQK